MGDVSKCGISGSYGRVNLYVIKPSNIRGGVAMNLLISDLMPLMNDIALSRIYDKLRINIDGMNLIVKFDNDQEILSKTSTIFSGKRRFQLINYSIPAFLNSYDMVTNICDEICHEDTHASMREYIGIRNWGMIPRWWKEGCALWTSWPQGPSRSFILYVRDLLPRSDLITGLRDSDFDFNNYPESFYAIDLIERFWGVQAIRDINNKLKSGIPFRNALENILNISYDDFKEINRRYVSDKLDDLLLPRIIHQSMRRIIFKPMMG